MLRPDGYVKVLDFGIAKLAEQEVPATMPRDEALLLVETNLGSILGTVRYMSPEQACGAQVDKSTDIWSLGVVLYEMVTGHAPFTGDTPKEVMSSILEKEPPPLTQLHRAHCPLSFSRLSVKRCAKIAKNGITAHTSCFRRSKIFVTNWKSRLTWNAPLRRLHGCAGYDRPAALVLVLLVAALALALPFYWHRNLATSLPPDKSIAVLPLENLSEEKENAFFADGIQDELLSDLSKIADLKVISRTSVSCSTRAGPNATCARSAQQLGVAHVRGRKRSALWESRPCQRAVDRCPH